MKNISEPFPVHSSTVLWAYFIEAGGRASKITMEGLTQARQQDGFTWVHLQCDAIDARQTMASLNLTGSVIESLEALDTRPKTVQIDDGLLIYLRGINNNPDADPQDMVSLRIWFTQDGIVSARRQGRKLLSVQDVREQLEQGMRVENSGALVLELIKQVVVRIGEMVDILDEELVGFETADEITTRARQRLAVVRRQAAAIRRYLAPQRDALDALYRANTLLSTEQVFFVREQTDRMTRYVEDLDLARERALVLQDELRNRIAQKQGMVLYVLSLVTAIFLPLSFLTGIFGMNVGGLPGVDNPQAFNQLAIGMLVLAVVMGALMIWKKWF
ncbi:MAG: zinc transporter [Paraglaciecola sp.]|jgi:zinc transporter